MNPSLDDGFDSFWENFPRKIDKKPARRAWKRLKKSDRALVMKGLELWKRSRQWTKDRGEYIPYASTFLNKERWREQPPEMQRAEPARTYEDKHPCAGKGCTKLIATSYSFCAECSARLA